MLTPKKLFHKMSSPSEAQSDTTNYTNTTSNTTPDPIANMEEKIVSHEEDNDDYIDRDVSYVAFGPKGAWYVKWTDGTSAWELLAPNLHTKLAGRNKSLPSVASLSISSENQWVTVFKDGSFATSGFPMSGKMKEAFFHDVEPKLFIFAPAGGWLLVRQDGSMNWERLPSSLDLLLKRRMVQDPPIQQIAISGFGGWFIRFSDGYCFLMKRM
jgi:hypothetical protein